MSSMAKTETGNKSKKKDGDKYDPVSSAEAFVIEGNEEEGLEPTFEDEEDLPAGSKNMTLDKRMEIDEGQVMARGEFQSPAYRDKWFAIAFLVQFLVVILIACVSGFPAISRLNSATNDGYGDINDRRNLKIYEHATGRRYAQEYQKYDPNNTYDANGNRVYEPPSDDVAAFNNDDFSLSESSGFDDGDLSKQMTVFVTNFLPTVIIVSIISAPLLSFGALALMAQHSELLLEVSLLLSVAINVILFFVALIAGSQAAVTYLIFALVLAWYAKVVWSRVPYAASTLKCAVTAVRANYGVAILALGTIPIMIAWLVFWVASIIGSCTWSFMFTEIVSESSSSFGDDDTFEQSDISGIGVFVICLLTISYYWTSQVVKNSVRTTIAGVIGTWWFSPLDASSFCSSAVRDSFIRSNTYSLGSIAFGSLIVAIIQFIKNTVTSARNRHRLSCLSLIMECLLVYIERIAAYFHKWAFVYVGLYGYGYIDAGRAVMTLFQQRGFTAIISDNIVHRMLGMVGFCIGLLIGLGCALVGWIFGEVEGDGGVTAKIFANVSFFCGMIIGAILSNIVMGAVGSSADAIIVCYAEAPAEFKQNHPALHDEMESSWSSMTATSSLTQAAAVAVADMDGGAGVV